MSIDHMVNDLLDLAAMDAARLVLRPERFELAALAGELVATFAPGAQTALTVEPGGPITVVADASRIRRVIGNLVRGAIGHVGGAPLRVRIERRGPMARVSACVHSTAVTPGDGGCDTHAPLHGLGRYTSRRIVQAHGGRVGVERSGDVLEPYVELPVNECVSVGDPRKTTDHDT